MSACLSTVTNAVQITHARWIIGVILDLDKTIMNYLYICETKVEEGLGSYAQVSQHRTSLDHDAIKPC